MTSGILNLIFSFTFFSLLGWVLEVVYRSTRDRRFVNPGLLKGPYLMLYGTAALILTGSVSLIHEYPVFVKAGVYFVLTTGIELISGFNARYFFNARLWDYSGQPFNYKGHICLKFSIYWVALAFAFEYIALPLHKLLMAHLPLSIMGGASVLLLSLMIFDFVMALRKKGRVIVMSNDRTAGV